jgi:hypothetical protein
MYIYIYICKKTLIAQRTLQCIRAIKFIIEHYLSLYPIEESGGDLNMQFNILPLMCLNSRDTSVMNFFAIISIFSLQ